MGTQPDYPMGKGGAVCCALRVVLRLLPMSYAPHSKRMNKFHRLIIFEMRLFARPHRIADTSKS